jgi:hypothetical protein
MRLAAQHSLVSWEDRARSNPAYVHAAIEAARIFVRVHDNPALKNPQTGSGLSRKLSLSISGADGYHRSTYRRRKESEEEGKKGGPEGPRRPEEGCHLS